MESYTKAQVLNNVRRIINAQNQMLEFTDDESICDMEVPFYQELWLYDIERFFGVILEGKTKINAAASLETIKRSGLDSINEIADKVALELGNARRLITSVDTSVKTEESHISR